MLEAENTLHRVTLDTPGHVHRPGQEFLDIKYVFLISWESFWFQQQTTQPCPCERRTTKNSHNILFC